MNVRWRGPSVRLAVAVSLVALVSLGAGIATALGNDGLPDRRPSIGGWPEDTNGDELISDTGDERIPELIRAAGDHGVEGYVRFDDLEGPQPSDPEEALAMSGKERVIPLYSEDGTTIVDSYSIT
jgi:hypothetical protein